MFTLTASLPDEKWCVEVLRKVRWNGHVTCPHCNSDNVKKDGRYRTYQKYRCKCCRKWFNDKTGTAFHYSHTPLRTWFLVLYIFFVLWPGCSMREAALETGTPYARCYRLVRTVMEKLKSLPEVKLGGTSESDEFYIKAGLKGRPYHDEIVKSGRKPRKRGLKPWRGRGTFEKEQPMITCIHERGGMTVFDVPIKQPLVDVVCGSVSYGSTVYTDEYGAYDQLQEHGFVHECVSHSGKEYARGDDVHVNNCECRSNLCQLWLKKFMGVNRHNLKAYVKSFQFVHNRRDKTREERFMDVLC